MKQCHSQGSETATSVYEKEGSNSYAWCDLQGLSFQLLLKASIINRKGRECQNQSNTTA